MSCSSDVLPPLLRVVHTGDLRPRIEGGVIALYWLSAHSGDESVEFAHKNSLKAEEWAGLCPVCLEAQTQTLSHTSRCQHSKQCCLSSCHSFLVCFPLRTLLLLSDMITHPLPSVSSSLLSFSSVPLPFCFPGLQDRFPQV